MGLLKKAFKAVGSVFKKNRAEKKKKKAVKLTAKADELLKRSSENASDAGFGDNMEALWDNIVNSSSADSVREPLDDVQQAVFNEKQSVPVKQAGFMSMGNPFVKWGLRILGIYLVLRVLKIIK